PLKDIFEPAIALARKGVAITEREEKQLVTNQDAIARVSGSSSYFAQNYIAGDTLKHEALANTLERILANGSKEFYTGKTAEKIVAFLQSHGGIVTKEDLAAYGAKWRRPVTFTYRGFKVISMSPPSSGGITLAQILKMIEPYPVKKYQPNSVEAIQLIAEAERRAYADRSYFLGDPDFVKIPLKQLLDTKYLKSRMKNYVAGKATASSEVAHGNIDILESNETTHYSIVDAEGNAVAVTTTLNGAYGSKLYSDELGFFFNNEMDDFSSKPGVPNSYGLIGAEANAIAPGKRMLSSMTPTIVEKNGKLLMVLGTPGGSTIITSVLQTIINVCDYGMGMQQAVDMPRFHHQYIP
ncbi:MAG: gamma-glutamyltransferase, partial [Sphingobacteriales bacterium]